jgi:predicted transcriptional regulator
MNISNQIRAKRLALRVSQITLAKEVKMSRYSLSMFECGYKKLPAMEIFRLKAALKEIEEKRGVPNA